MNNMLLVHRDIAIDPVTGVPTVYARFFTDNLVDMKNIDDQEDDQIIIKLKSRRKKKVETTVENIPNSINMQGLIKSLKKELNTKCTIDIETNTMTIGGNKANEVKAILEEKYKIPSDKIEFKTEKEGKPSNIIIRETSEKGKTIIIIENVEAFLISQNDLVNIIRKRLNKLAYQNRNGMEKIIKVESDDITSIQNIICEKYNITEENFDIISRSSSYKSNKVKSNKFPAEPKYIIKEIARTDITINHPNKISLLRNLGKFQSYYDENMDMIIDMWNEAKEMKESLSHESILDFTKGMSINVNNQEQRIWTTIFTAREEAIAESGMQVSNSYINLNDVVILSFKPTDEDPYFNRMVGKVISITNFQVTARFKLPIQHQPPDYSDMNNYKDRIIYQINFEPNPVIYKRRAQALTELVLNRDNVVSQVVVLKNPVDKHSNRKKFDLNDAAFDFSNSPIEVSDRSRLKFDATPTQTRAVNMALNNMVTLVQGPPGCGKTMTITAMVINMLQLLPSQRIMVCGQSNASVENIIKLLGPPCKALGKKVIWAANGGFDITSFHDLTDEQKCLLHYQCLTRETRDGKRLKELTEKSWRLKDRMSLNDVNEMENLRKHIEKNIAYESNVICCTLESALKGCISDLKCHTVIIDEATQAIEISSIVPFVHSPEKIVLVGDQHQLGPVITDAIEKYQNYKESLFVRLLNRESYGRKIDFIMLDVQYRMHPKICRFPSFCFYDGGIIDGISSEDRWSPLAMIKMPITYINCKGVEKKVGSSIKNENEAQTVKIVVNYLLNNNIEPKDIGVIAFYSAQVRHLRHKLEILNTGKDKFKIASVDSFQGSERDYIVLSCTRSNELSDIGFLSQWRRLNVAITRARRGLIIVGNIDTIQNDETWKSLIEYINFASGETLVKFMKRPKVEKPNRKISPLNITFHRQTSFEEEDLDEEYDPFIERFDDPSSGINMREVKSTISGGNFKILWPDNEEDVSFLTNYVNERVNLMNRGNYLTIAYDAESVCIQFGEVFDNNDIFASDSLPPIGNKEGIIAFFYSKNDGTLNDALMKIVKPLFEHKNVTILTFDFTQDFDLLKDFKINPNPERVIDNQLIDINLAHNEENLIEHTSVKSLKIIVSNLKYNGEFSKDAKKYLNEGEKDFSHAIKKFMIMKTEMPEISIVTKEFLNYSANDVAFTALATTEVFIQESVEKVRTLTKKKLVDFKAARKTYEKAINLREASFVRTRVGIAMTHNFSEDDKAEENIKLWDKMKKIQELLNINNQEINKILRVTDAKVLDDRVTLIENFLTKNINNFNYLCSRAKLGIPPNHQPKSISRFDI